MRWAWRTRLLLGTAMAGALCAPAVGQVFTVGEASATADVNTDFKATRVELPDGRMTERGRRELIRDLESEQGFAHRELPAAANLVLQANGNLTPGAAGYKKLIYDKGEFAKIGDRVSVTALEVKGNKILVDLNGGPYLKHRFLRHIQIGVGGPTGGTMAGGSLNDGAEVTGCRVTLVFEGAALSPGGFRREEWAGSLCGYPAGPGEKGDCDAPGAGRDEPADGACGYGGSGEQGAGAGCGWAV
jgi:hypothetical protein